ncbi:hypothetical protein BDV12DRAFT_31559 [Aspergillus spectabilis]
MLSTYSLSNFKPCTPLPKKPFPHLSHRKPHRNPPPSTLPISNHNLPARPPAKACVPPSTKSISTSQQQGMSVPLQDTCLEGSQHNATSPQNSAPWISDPDSSVCFDIQDNTGIPIESPAILGDFSRSGLLSPGIPSLDHTLEELSMLSDAQADIPIDPKMIANLRPLEESDHDQHVQQDCSPVFHNPSADYQSQSADSQNGIARTSHQHVSEADDLIQSETICPYPDPPPVSDDLSEKYQDQDHNQSGGNPSDSIRANDHPDIYDNQLRSYQRDINSDSPNSDHVRPHHHTRVKSRISKQRQQRSDITIRSLYESASIDDRLQFLSWLFQCASERGMYNSGMPESSCEDRDTRATSCQSESKQSRHCKMAKKLSKNWSQDGIDFLMKLGEDRSLKWRQRAEIFSQRYPGRTLGAIKRFHENRRDEDGPYEPNIRIYSKDEIDLLVELGANGELNWTERAEIFSQQ